MCLYRELIRNARYRKNKKNGGVIPPFLDGRVLHVPMTCGECMECRAAKRRDWQLRLTEDIKANTNGKLVVLTFSNESVTAIAKKVNQVTKKTPRKTITLANGKKRTYYKTEVLQRTNGIEGYDLDNAIATYAMREFNELWRKKYGKALRHWTVTELGHRNTENIHLHGIIWTNEPYSAIRERWKYGFIWPRPHEEKTTYVGERTINYNIKYVHKMDKDHPNYKSIILASPGVGRNYVDTNQAGRNKYNGNDTVDTYKTSSGHNVAMPTYWRKKLYSDEEREKLWIQKLDKGEKWVNKEKMERNISEEDYLKVINYYRELNKELGYGEGKPDWKKAELEKERREILHGKRGIQYGKNITKEWKPQEYIPHEDWDESYHWMELNYILNNDGINKEENIKYWEAKLKK